MRRTVVYPKGTEAFTPEEAAPSPADKYGDKLVKYIPAEVIAFYVPAYALVPGDNVNWGRWLVLALGASGTVGYLLIRSEKNNMPRVYFFILAVIAFFAWAMGTSSVGKDLFNIEEWLGKLTIIAAVFLIPMIDEILTKFWPISSEP